MSQSQKASKLLTVWTVNSLYHFLHPDSAAGVCCCIWLRRVATVVLRAVCATHENLSHARSVLRPAGRCTGVSAHGSSRHDQNKIFQHPPIPRVTCPIPFTHAGYGGQAHGWPSLGENCPWDAKNFLVRAQRFAPAGARASGRTETRVSNKITALCEEL